jgi:hypothetical protein
MAYLLISVKVDGLLYFHPPYKYNRTEKTYIYNNNYKVDINICTIETGLWDNLREQDLFISRIKLKIENTNVQSIMRLYMERIILTMSIEYVQNVTIDLLEMNQYFQTLEIGSLLQIYVRKTKYF